METYEPIDRTAKEVSFVGKFEMKMRELEYNTLRQELLENKKFMFERPIAIVVGLAVIYGKLPSGSLEPFFPLLLVVLLGFNLRFTFGRVQSITRIAGYLHVVLEGQYRIRWIGWENALWRHRAWATGPCREERKRKLNELIGRRVVEVPLSDYNLLFWFHVIAIGLGLSLIIHSVMPEQLNFPIWLSLLIGLTIGKILFVFIVPYCVPWYPKQVQGLMHEQKVLWQHLASKDWAEKDP